MKCSREMLIKRHLQFNGECIEILYMNVAKENQSRALRFMDTLIKLLNSRGHRFESGKNGTGSVFFSEGVEIEISLREALKRKTARASEEIT